MKACAAWLALWNDVTPAVDDEYNEWHGTEHVPERLTLPGFLKASRYRAQYDNQTRYLTWYGLAGLEALESQEYRSVLMNPTPWSQKMRPHLHNVRRCACVTRLASTDRPGRRVQVSLLANGELQLAAERAKRLPLLLGEVDESVAPLPWLTPEAKKEAAGAEKEIRWVRMETLESPLPGTYSLLQEF